MRCISISFFLFVIINLYGQTISLTHIEADSGKNLLPFSQIWTDTTAKFSFESVIKQNFEVFDTTKVKEFKKGNNYWLKFTLHNTSDNKILRGGIQTHFMPEIHLYSDSFYIKNGGDVPYSQRALPLNQKFLPITLQPNKTRTFYCQFVTQYLSAKPILFTFKSVEKEEKDRLNQMQTNSSMILFRCFFVGILFAVALFALAQYRFLGQKALIYYALFAISNAFFFLRSIENLTGWNIIFARFGNMMQFEAPFSYASSFSYILFFSSFLNVSNKLEKLNNILIIIAKIVMAIFVIDIVLQFFFPLTLSLKVLEIVRLLFFLVLLYSLYLIFFKLRNKQGHWLGAGTLVVVLGALLSNAENLFNGYYHPFWGGAMRKIEFSTFSIYFYDMKTALLLEVICFYIAIHLKLRDDKLAKEQAEKQNSELMTETQTLKKQLEVAKDNFNTQHATHKNEFVLRGAKIVTDNLANDQFSVEEFAQRMNMSRSVFSLKWKKETHKSPAEYIRNRRFEFACQLLLSSQLPISEIAERCGFKETAHFTNSFTKRFGMPPSEFRRLG